MGISQVRITTLSDNTASQGFEAEWGLSLLIEAAGKRILFDTGASDITVNNARMSGADLSHLDAVVLSHGHADHSGGLLKVLGEAGATAVLAHPDIFSEKFVLRPGEETPRSICIPFTRRELEKAGARFILSREPGLIMPGIMTSGEIPMTTAYEKIEDALLVRINGLLEADKLADDQSLIINACSGLIVITGCAHRGVVNTLLHARKLTGISTVAAVIGGMHLLRAQQERIESTVSALKAMGVQRLIVSHCTGTHASERLKQEFGEFCVFNSAGSRFELP